jgi:hypothetical protein
VTERQCTFPIAPEVYMKMTPAERDAAGTATFEQQQRRDGSGMLRAIEQSGRDRERLQRGEVTREGLDQQETDDLARIGLCTDEPWDTMSRDERRKALRKAYGRYPVTTGSLWDD